MNSNLKWKALFIVAVILACVIGLVGRPDFPPKSWAGIKSNFANSIKLGLDLQGGTHLILQVQVQEAISGETDQTLDHITSTLRDKGIRYDDIRKLSDTQILVHNIAPEQAGTARNLINDQFPDWDISPAPGENSGYVVTMKQSRVVNIQQQTMDQAEETIRRRIDALGLTEPLVAPYGQGDNEIIVELPGEGDPNRAKSVIQAGGQLELHLVLDQTPYQSEVAALAAHGGILPPNAQVVQGKSSASSSSQPAVESWYVIDRVPIVTGRDLRSATAIRSTKNPGYYDVDFTLSTEAGRRFGPFTEQNIGKQLGIVLEHKLQTAPVINGRIDDTGVIEGQFGEQEANDLGLVLRSGALPASIKYLEERTVGPSLGADSIRHGVQASIISLVVVMIFMVVYYRSAGVNAVIALILNLVLLLAALAYFGAVLTLPGIAGVILTIGMGVDSNVLIFERIREELRAAKAPVSAVDMGFKRAFLTIIDTHVTTIVSAAFLFLFGTGPIRGFAVSLAVGLLANLFTSVYVSRLIFDWHLAKMPREAELSI
ncbi:MAG TPA: protein translocase subunit SecD [Candidatus Saccharimonadales bacterium]|jgi:preprotein translocase subunit SecD|nr:protein translocase subunit SecD [Candidatus Saccharimonadales bacterium]